MREDTGPLTSPAVKRFVRERGAVGCKALDRVEFVDAFPESGVDKISKKGLRTTAVSAERH